MTDGILLAETQGDRAARRLRHDHRRRGARAQPQHRLPARLPEAAAAAAARPQGRSSRRPRSTPSASRGTSARAGAPAPVIEVSGRTYPVEVRYRPLADGRRRGRRRGGARGRDRRRGRGSVARRARRHPRVPARRARDPRDRGPAAQRPRAPALRGGASRSCRSTRGCRSREQQRVFAPSRAAGASCSRPTSPRPRSRCPGIRYVIDTGLARVKRYSLRNKTTLLQIEKISQAAAQPARGTLRPRRRRHLRAPLRRGRFRGAPAVHRTRDPAQLARRGDPAHGGARPRRGRRVSVRRAAGAARDRRRLPAAAGARRGRRRSAR